MACRSCQNKNKKGGYNLPAILDAPPLGASDVQVYEDGEIHRLTADDWTDEPKLLLWFPETFTPVCQTEMGNLNDWVGEFNKLGLQVWAATSDPIHAVKDWFENEPSLANPKYKVISSYVLPTKMNLMNNGRVKRASVFITPDGEVVIQEHFHKVGRSLAELHRMYYAYTTDSYCGEGWKDPSDGFLDDKK